MRGGKTLPSMLGKDCESSCCYEHCRASVRQGDNCWKIWNIVEESPSSPSWIHVQARGWIGQVIWLPYSTVGRNVATPFVFLWIVFRYVYLPLSILNGYAWLMSGICWVIISNRINVNLSLYVLGWLVCNWYYASNCSKLEIILSMGDIFHGIEFTITF